MSATLTVRKFMERRTGAFLHYLHIDLATAGLALLFVVVGGVTADFSLFQAKTSAANHRRGRDCGGCIGLRARPQRLPPTMVAALDQVAQRYRVSAEALQPVFEAAQAAGREWRVDPCSSSP